MSGRSVRIGKAWEREVARDLTEATGLPFARSLREARDGNTGDVLGEGAGIVVQCKAGAAPRVYGVPAERFAVIPWERFLTMVATLVNGGGER